MNGTFLDRTIFIGAYLQDSLIGFVKLVANEEWRSGGIDADCVDDPASG